MNILFLSDGYPSKGLPYSAFIGVLCEELVRHGCEITVIAPQSYTKHIFRGTTLAPKRMIVPVQTDEGPKEIIVYLPYSLTFGDGRYGKLTLLMNKWTTERCIKKIRKKPDVIYAHFWKSAYNVIDYAINNQIPLFVSSGEDKVDIQTTISDEEICKLRNCIKGCICVSSKNQKESIKTGLVAASKTTVIPNSINPNEFYLKDKYECRKKYGYSEDDFIVAFCGRFIHRKGVMRVSEAITLLHNKDIKSIFIGSNYENEKERPDCDGILFMGQLSHSEIVDYLNCADVFVLPTLAEGCSNSIIEAMACGLPIISSDLPFNYDILDSSNSILIDPMNVQEIANAIQDIKENPTKRKALSDGALKKASELTIEKRAKKIIDYIINRSRELA